MNTSCYRPKNEASENDLWQEPDENFRELFSMIDRFEEGRASVELEQKSMKINCR